jgi:hypothetical protein
MYFIRRWNLDRYLYNKDARKKIDESCNRCIKYFEKAIEEFRIAGKSSEQAHTVYNLATKMFLLFNRFSHAKKLLDKARFLASSTKEKGLLNRISQFEQEITNKNKKSRDYVREMGLDMPNGRHPFL